MTNLYYAPHQAARCDTIFTHTARIDPLTLIATASPVSVLTAYLTLIWLW